MAKAVKGITQALGAIPAFITGGVKGVLNSLAITASVAIGGPLALVAVGLNVLRSAMAPDLPSIKATGQAINSRQPISSATIVYGRAHVGGPIIFYHAIQGDDEYRYFIVTLAGHEIDAIESVLLNDEVVTLSGNAVTSGDYAGKAWIWPQTGASSDTPPSAFTSETGGRWTSAHKGAGCAKLYCKFELTDEIISKGMPKMTAIVRGKKVYDPRDETTAYSNNAALCFWDYMLTPRAEGGYGLEDIEMDWAHVAAEANVCDEAVALKAGGTEPRYTCDGVIDTGAGPDTVRSALLLAMAGTYAEVGPRVIAYAGAWQPVSEQLSEDDLTASVSYRPLGTNDTYTNLIRATFVSKDDKWQPIDLPTVRAGGTDDEDDQALDIEFPFTKSPAMAQRIMKIVLNRARAERSLTWPMNAKGMSIQPLDNVTISQTLYPHLANYAFLVAGWSLNADFGVTLRLVEESEDYYEWSASEEQDIQRPSTSLVTINPSQIGAGAAVANLAAEDGDAAGKIDLTWTMPATVGTISWTLYRAAGSTDFGDAAVLTSGAAVASAAVTYTDTGLTTGVSYSYWIRTFVYFGSATLAGPETHTAP